MGEVGIVCAFARGWEWFPENYGKLLAAATGVKDSADMGYLRKVGERIINLERAFNVREGFGRKDDKLPARMLTEPLPTFGAPGEGEIVREMEHFLDRYYELPGWNEEGIPTAKKLSELGLAKMAKDISRC